MMIMKIMVFNGDHLGHRGRGGHCGHRGRGGRGGQVDKIDQDLNSATDVKLAVIAEVTQGSKPVLGAKVIIIIIITIIVATMMINIAIALMGFLRRLWPRWSDLKELQSYSHSR